MSCYKWLLTAFEQYWLSIAPFVSLWWLKHGLSWQLQGKWRQFMSSADRCKVQTNSILIRYFYLYKSLQVLLKLLNSVGVCVGVWWVFVSDFLMSLRCQLDFTATSRLLEQASQGLGFADEWHAYIYIYYTYMQYNIYIIYNIYI